MVVLSASSATPPRTRVPGGHERRALRARSQLKAHNSQLAMRKRIFCRLGQAQLVCHVCQHVVVLVAVYESLPHTPPRSRSLTVRLRACRHRCRHRQLPRPLAPPLPRHSVPAPARGRTRSPPLHVLPAIGHLPAPGQQARPPPAQRRQRRATTSGARRPTAAAPPTPPPRPAPPAAPPTPAPPPAMRHSPSPAARSTTRSRPWPPSC